MNKGEESRVQPRLMWVCFIKACLQIAIAKACSFVTGSGEGELGCRYLLIEIELMF